MSSPFFSFPFPVLPSPSSLALAILLLHPPFCDHWELFSPWLKIHQFVDQETYESVFVYSSEKQFILFVVTGSSYFRNIFESHTFYSPILMAASSFSLSVQHCTCPGSLTPLSPPSSFPFLRFRYCLRLKKEEKMGKRGMRTKKIVKRMRGNGEEKDIFFMNEPYFSLLYLLLLKWKVEKGSFLSALLLHPTIYGKGMSVGTYSKRSGLAAIDDTTHFPFPKYRKCWRCVFRYLQLQQVGSIGARDWVIPMFANAKQQKGERQRHTISQKNTATIS